MIRATTKFTDAEYDIAVIGGGIYGAWVAWDAALRGLKVALVEQGDFASGTSSHSQKIVHGGLRYLQHADLVRMRESIRERSTLMRVAPHLTAPLPCLIPTYKGQLSRGRLALGVALKLNDLISFDRNRDMPDTNALPAGRLVSKRECLELCPGLDPVGLTGGALFYDGQVQNPERLILSILHSATGVGADLANYTRVTGFLREGDAVRGLELEDRLTGDTLTLYARLVINCGGPWIHKLLELHSGLRKPEPARLFKAIILVTRPVVQEVAVGVTSGVGYRDSDAVIDKGYRFFFITPWRDTSLIGTFYDAFEGDPATVSVTEADIEQALEMTNAAYPGARLTRHDVRYAYRGLLPRADAATTADDIQYAKHYRIYDHGETDAVQGLVSVLGVKYTTARDVAEKAVDLALRKLGRGPVRCRTRTTPVHGGASADHEAVRSSPGKAELAHLVATYGSAYPAVLQLLQEEPGWGEPVASDLPVLQAEVVYGVRAEMAHTLTDTLLRRTELGTHGYPGDECLDSCAALMAAELGWSAERVAREINDAQAVYRLFQRPT